MEAPYDKLAKIYTNWFDHVTKMAECPYIVKTSFQEPEGP